MYTYVYFMEFSSENVYVQPSTQAQRTSKKPVINLKKRRQELFVLKRHKSTFLIRDVKSITHICYCFAIPGVALILHKVESRLRTDKIRRRWYAARNFRYELFCGTFLLILCKAVELW